MFYTTKDLARSVIEIVVPCLRRILVYEFSKVIHSISRNKAYGNYEGARANNIGETLIDNVKVWGVPSRKAEARVTVTDGVNVSIITEDVVDATVQNREDAYSSAALTVRNPKNKYSWISPISEIEVAIGNESVMWLLFRGYIEAPKRSYPPAMLSIESSKGYNKRLDFREAYDEAYNDESGVIVIDLLEKYFPDVFTEDHVALGEVMNVTYQASSIAKILKELADANGFVAYIDFNKDLHFVDPLDEQSQSNLLIEKEGDVIQISVEQIDEIINKVRQEGALDEDNETIVYTAEDPASEEDYWTREHTFKDSSLADAASVQLKAEELVAKNASLITEVDVALPQIEPLEINDLLTITFNEVNLDEEIGIVKSIRYVYGAGGVRTDFKTHHHGYFLSDTLAKLHNIVSQLDVCVHNVPPPGNGELPPPISARAIMRVSLSSPTFRANLLSTLLG